MNETAHNPLSLRIRNLIGFSALVMLIFCLVVAFHSSQGYKQAMEEGQEKAESMVNSLVDHTELTFLVADMTLRRAIERQAINALFGENLTEYTNHQFKVWLDETPQVAAIALIDENGKVKVAAHKAPEESWLDSTGTLKGKEMFDTMQETGDNEVFIGLHTTDTHAYIVLSRRVSKPNGDFGGIVIAAISPEYFSDFYHSIAFGERQFMSISLINPTTKSSVILSSGPDKQQKNYVSLLAEVNKRSHTKVVNGNVSVDLIDKYKEVTIIGSRRLKNMPIVVHTVLHESDVLADWQHMRSKDIGFLALFILFGSVLSFFAIAMARQISRAEESESTAVMASQAKSEFLANMSHELRTPLNAIIGYSEMINSEYFGPLNQKQKDRIHDINLCGSHLLQLINDILEFSKGEAGKLELSEEKVNIAEIINECARISHGKARTKSINLLTTIDPNLPFIWGDRRKITQILLNLLTNALKFTPEGGTIRINAALDAQHALILSVTDTGIGMEEDEIPRALSVFGQVHRSQSHEGTGLGLPLCKMYTELHGGKLILNSKKGSGTTVRVIFPHQRTLLIKKR